MGDRYDSAADLLNKKAEFVTIPGLRANSEIYYMPGFFMVNETFSARKKETIKYQIKGDCFLISLFYNGQCMIRDRQTGAVTTFEAGMICSFLTNNGSWEMIIPPGQEISHLSLLLSQPFLAKLMQTEIWAITENAGKRAAHRSLFSPGRLEFLNQDIKNILHQLLNKVYEERYLRGHIELKLRELLFMMHTRSDESAVRRYPPLIYNKLIAAKAYLIEHFADSPTIMELARIVSLNEFSLKSQFKSLFGTTIHHFVIRLRMDAANRMLLENKFVAEVAGAIGYQSVSHFIAVYKKHFGQTPKQTQFIKNPS